MIDQRARKLSETSQKPTESTLGVYETVWDFFVQAQECQTRSTRAFFEERIADLRTKVEGNLASSEELAEQVRRGQEATRLLAWESVNAYTEFLDSLFLYYRESTKGAEANANQRRQNASLRPGA